MSDPMPDPISAPTADLLIEVGCEELPASYIAPALAALEAGLLKLLAGVAHAGTRGFSTPRRLCVVVEGLAPGKPRNERVMTGPALSVAQKDGEWTRAAQGFARGKGASVEALQIVEGPKGPQIAVVVSQGGETVQALVGAGLDKLVMGLPFKKSMTWKAGTRWARPIRRITAVYGGEVIPVTVGGLVAGAEVSGHRRSKLAPAPVSGAADYLAALEARWVLADRDVRRARIEAQLSAAAEAAGVSLSLDPGLVDEVTDLVEWPQVVTGRFEEQLLSLPPRLLITSMKVHQRTFPTYRGDAASGALSNVVLIVSNAPEGDPKLISEGNARVLAARFHDATFFFAEDRKLSLEEHAADLSKMRWVRGLGTMDEKQARVSGLAGALASTLGADVAATARAGALCKADLLTQMVGEFPELQGYMGRLYAMHQTEPGSVCVAIEEHYLPRFAGDTLPATLEGRAVALADRLDSLAGCFGAGLKPKGSADPQGLRRAANGVIAILLAHGQSLSLGALFEAAIARYDADALKGGGGALKGDLVRFTLGRLRGTLRDEGYATDVVEAVLSGTGRPGMATDDVVSLRERAAAIMEMSGRGDFAGLMTTFKRVLNITREHESHDFDTAALVGPEERALVERVEQLSGDWGSRHDVPVGEMLEGMRGLKGPVDAFFDAVMVMAEEPEIRAARLGLLTAIARMFLAVADFRKISTEL